ncbi:MAG: hypothetical protein NTV56_08595 [Alphaproteobacteria bacterium]|nr:hypothetical protein [Alphaproteobacteria bacterium]
MKIQSALIAAVAGTWVMAGSAAQAQSQTPGAPAQAPGQTQASDQAPPPGKTRAIVNIPSNPAGSAVQSGVTSARDDAARRAKVR